ncbi:hypothetical protein [Marinomonas transparens]|nr:hypothetical protein [Marinomonas transparens]
MAIILAPSDVSVSLAKTLPDCKGLYSGLYYVLDPHQERPRT